MKIKRRSFLKGVGGALALPLLESFGSVAMSSPTRFLVVGNPLGMHPDNFFPQTFGHDYRLPQTLQSLVWLRDRLTVISHPDYGMVSGHGRAVTFATGLLPPPAGFPVRPHPERAAQLSLAQAAHGPAPPVVAGRFRRLWPLAVRSW